MEPTDDVLVVIQAESGEEIALPLAALDEQHQEVIVDGDGGTGEGVVVCENSESYDEDQSAGGVNERAEVLEKPASEAVRVLRPKQKRKQKLIYLPLSEEDMKLEFRIIDEPSPQQNEETRKKPRREYRTRKKLAALEAANNDNEATATSPMTTTHTAAATTTTTTTTTIAAAEVECESENLKESSEQQAQQAAVMIKEELDTKSDHENRSEQASPRRTRLSNACRVATSKLYKCTECDFTTERINNIVMHMKESCHKMGKN